jgi:hypothetical protein
MLPVSAWIGCRWGCLRGACRSSAAGCRSKKRDQQRFDAMRKNLNKLREAAKEENKKMALLYFDEAGMRNVPNVQRSWAPLAKPHSADATIERKRINVLGALNYAAGTLASEVHERSVRRQDVVHFLDRKARHFGTRQAYRGGHGQRPHSPSHSPQNVGRVDGSGPLHLAFFAALQPRDPPHRNPLEAGQVPPALVRDLGKKRLSQ